MSDPHDPFDIKAFANSVVLKQLPFPIITDPSDKPPFIVSLDQSLARMRDRHELLLPNLRDHTKTVLVFSEYGGEAASSRFLTYGFLLVSYDAHLPILKRLKEVRNKHGLDSPFKEVCFKDLGYGPIKRCLQEWLAAADFSVGLLFTLIVEKEVVSLFGANVRESQHQLTALMSEAGLGSRKPAVAEKMLRILHTISYWLAVLTNEDQGVCWMTDEDEIVANREFVKDMHKMLPGIMANYLQRKGKIATALPFPKTVDQFGITDFLSIPDLVAGSIESLFTRSLVMAEPQIRVQANDILLWLCRQGIGLKKLAMTVRVSSEGRIQTSMASFGPKNAKDGGECILIDI